MSKGTEPTPIQLTPRFSLSGQQNMRRLQDQLLDQGASAQALLDFAAEADRVRKSGTSPGQIEPITVAARHIGAEVHWTP